jgi:hypothetical protein
VGESGRSAGLVPLRKPGYRDVSSFDGYAGIPQSANFDNSSADRVHLQVRKKLTSKTLERLSCNLLPLKSYIAISDTPSVDDRTPTDGYEDISNHSIYSTSRTNEKDEILSREPF